MRVWAFLILLAACSSSTDPGSADRRTVLFTNPSVNGYTAEAFDSAGPARFDVQHHLAGGEHFCVRVDGAQLMGDSTVALTALPDGGNVVTLFWIHVETVHGWTWDGGSSFPAATPTC